MSVKVRVRDAAAQLLFRTGVTAPLRRSGGRLSIATFHRVLPEAQRSNYPFPSLVVTPQELDALLGYLAMHFDCGALAAQHARYLGGESTQHPLLAITFDDGQYDNYLNARPVLARHGVKATFFVPVEAVDRQELLWHDRLGFAIQALIRSSEGSARLMPILLAAGLSSKGSRSAQGVVQQSKGLALDARLRLVEALEAAAGTAGEPAFARLMTFKELSELAAEGHEIGSHSMSHCMMPECDDRALEYELVESRQILQSRIAADVESFCYPNGNSDLRTADAVARAGYRRAVTTAWGNNGPARQFQLRRYDMVAQRVQDSRGRFLPALLAFRMSGFYPGLR